MISILILENNIYIKYRNLKFTVNDMAENGKVFFIYDLTYILDIVLSEDHLCLERPFA